MTTPTPDRGALERVSPDFVEPPMRSIARKVLARVEAAQAPGDDSDQQEAWSIIEDALTAAASEARAAAIACCSPKADEAWTREAARTGELIAERIGAIATPAQPEGK